MSCSNFERLIALYVEDDLSASERGQVKAHLQECSDCWDLAEDLRQSQALFKTVRQEVPNSTALSVLRERVLSEVSGLESTTWFERLLGGLRRKTALAGAALAMVGIGAFWMTRSPHVDPVEPTVVTVEPAPAAVVPVRAPEPVRVSVPVRPAPKRVPRPAPRPDEETRQVAIKFVTDDPNVIIYWLVDEKGD